MFNLVKPEWIGTGFLIPGLVGSIPTGEAKI